MTTATATLTGWVKLVDFDKCSAVPIGFVGELANQFTPACITDCFGQSFISDHVFNAQTFTANHLVFVYQLGGQFVGKVAAAVGNLRLNASNFDSGFVEVGSSFLLLGKAALRLSQFLLVLCSMAGIARFKPVSGNHKVGQTQINTRCLFGNRQWFRLEAAQHRHEVAACTVFRDSDGSWFARKFTRPANIKRLFGLGNVDIAIFELKRRLREFCALLAALLLKGWILRPSFKEVLKRSLLMAQRLLERYTRHAVKPFKLSLLLEFGQLRACRVVVNLFAFVVESVGTPFKDRVVNETHTAESLCKQFSLFSGWVKALFNSDLFHGSQEYSYFCESKY